MIKELSMEFYKIRHRKVGLTVLAIIAVQFFVAAYSIKRMKPYELSQGWMYSLLLFAQLNCFFMPIALTVIGSRLSDIEHKGNTFKLLESIMPSSKLFTSKFLCGSVYILIAVIMQIVFIIFAGHLKGFTQEFPSGYFIYYQIGRAHV